MELKEITHIEQVYFLPPLAIARLGRSDTPLDCFVWDTDQLIHGSQRTTISPAVSLRVMANGSVRPFVPNVIQFRDGNRLRPVAPFFELWATVSGGGKARDVPLTVGLLSHLGSELDSVEYTITVANRKAQRRTLSAACAYIASVTAAGDDHTRKPLLAISPHRPGEDPLVSVEHPIPLGHFQVIMPVDRVTMGVDLSVLRVRFTPATGQVFAPPTTTAGPASPLPPGQALPSITLGGRMHDIVPKENRILNPGSKWSEYVMDAIAQEDPQPSDSYDGANVGDNRSWGVVDDTCDGVIEAQVVIKGVRYVATARVLSSCPDFAPDCRPLNCLADDLADRDLGPVDVDPEDEIKIAQTQAEIADLFQRAFETASLVNLDSNRYRAIIENETSDPDHPQVNLDSMTGKDKPYADLTADLFPVPPPPDTSNLSYTDAAHFRHGELCDVETLIDYFQGHADQVRQIIRPPFARFSQLPERADSKPNPAFRDPRVPRDCLHDMRMPPYLRDSDALPLSITVRQYDALMKLLRISPGHSAASPAKRRIKRFVQLRKKMPKDR
jgi:hypothetical protein